MAKAFNDNERKLIKDKLKEGALLFIQQQGVRKTCLLYTSDAADD